MLSLVGLCLLSFSLGLVCLSFSLVCLSLVSFRFSLLSLFCFFALIGRQILISLRLSIMGLQIFLLLLLGQSLGFLCFLSSEHSHNICE